MNTPAQLGRIKYKVSISREQKQAATVAFTMAMILSLIFVYKNKALGHTYALVVLSLVLALLYIQALFLNGVS